MQDMIRRIDHVSIAVRDLETAKRFFCGILGGRELYTATEAGEGFRWTAIGLGSSCALEIIDPAGEDSFLHRFLDRRGDGAHHITFQVNHLEGARTTLEARGVPTFGYNDADPNWTYFYVHPRHAFGVLLQFAEFEPELWVPPPDSGYGLAATEPGPVEVRRVQEHGTEAAVDISDGTRTLRVATGDLPELIAALRRLEAPG